MIERLKNRSGIALLMVLGALVVITTIAVEFAYNSHVNYELASSERDRLQAYYLARSAVQLTKLEVRVEKQLKAQNAGLLEQMKNSGIGTGLVADPLCKQIPLSTNLLKGLTSGILPGGDGPADTEDKQAASPFLSFEGDFESLCDTEERKINLNAFRINIAPALVTTPATSSPSTFPTPAFSLYDEQKELLIQLFSQKEFEPIFHDRRDEVRKVVNAIADWADRNDQIDEAPGIQGGSEDSAYNGPEFHYKAKNGKYVVPSELLLVSGVGDDLYDKIKSQITVFGDSRIHLCQASDEIVKALAQKYLQVAGGAAIGTDDDARWTAVLLAVRTACENPVPRVEEVAGALAAALGVAPSPALTRSITTGNRFYRINATATVRDSTVRIESVIDTGQANPNLWKTLYFKTD